MYSPPPEWAWPTTFCAFVTVATYVASIVTANVSQVDRLWTFLPTIYSGYFALLPLWPRQPLFPLCPYVPEELASAAVEYSPRALLMHSLVVLWMFRLSYNTFRRGLFSLTDEDYRWAVLRKQLPPWAFQVVNLSFIAIIQNILLLGLGLPSYIAVSHQGHSGLSSTDYVLAIASLVTLAVEFTADNQQYAFQSYKQSCLSATVVYDEAHHWPGARLKWTPADAKRGFVTHGLWAWSRHPNFTCEQLFWWLNALFPVLAREPPNLPDLTFQDVYNGYRMILSYLSTTPASEISAKFLAKAAAQVVYPFWPLTGAAALSCLFFASTTYSENITLSKYPGYAYYQGRVAMFGFVKTLEMGAYYRTLGSKQRELVESAVWGSDTGEEKNKRD